MLGNFTILDMQIDKLLVVFNLLVIACIAGSALLIVYLSKKMGEIFRNSVFCVMTSLVIASFFRTAVYDVIGNIFVNIGSLFSYACQFLTQRFFNELLRVVVFAARLVCPIIIKFAIGFFKVRPRKLASRAASSFERATDGILKGIIAKPSFHFIC